jgi:hypothetical protein
MQHEHGRAGQRPAARVQQRRRGTVLWKQGSLAGEPGRAERVGPHMGNRKERGEVRCGRFRPDKVLKCENGFLFILI